MQITVFASGSTGNCSLITQNDTRILVDAGISCRRIRAGLQALGLTPDDLDAILVTHEHIDHVAGLRVLEKKHPVPVYTTAPVIRALEQTGLTPSGGFHAIAAGEPWELGGIGIRAFHVPHDAADCIGFRMTGDGSVLGYATDIGRVTDEILYGLAGSDLALIEANHDLKMLQEGPYPYYLKQRILSDHGHLSNNDCGQLARTLAEEGTQRFILGHLSQQNNREETARSTVEQCLPGRREEVFVAPVLGQLTVGTKVV